MIVIVIVLVGCSHSRSNSRRSSSRKSRSKSRSRGGSDSGGRAGSVAHLRGIPGPPQPDLHHPLAVQQPLLHRASEGRAVRYLLAEHVLVHVGMSVHVHQTDLQAHTGFGRDQRSEQPAREREGRGLDIRGAA